jgi:hypothetical protein
VICSGQGGWDIDSSVNDRQEAFHTVLREEASVIKLFFLCIIIVGSLFGLLSQEVSYHRSGFELLNKT